MWIECKVIWRKGGPLDSSIADRRRLPYGQRGKVPAAATAIAEVMGMTLLLARSGETFVLSATPIWVRNVAMALTMPLVGWPSTADISKGKAL